MVGHPDGLEAESLEANAVLQHDGVTWERSGAWVPSTARDEMNTDSERPDHALVAATPLPDASGAAVKSWLTSARIASSSR